MGKVLNVIMLLLAVLSGHLASLAEEIRELPTWVKDLQSISAQTMQTEVKASYTNSRDYIDNKEYKVVRLKGEGSLKKLPDPFEAMERLFITNGWRKDFRYEADSHGSKGMAYGKGQCICIISVSIDSSCDDRDRGHIPSKFWFEIDCRETNVGQQ